MVTPPDRLVQAAAEAIDNYTEQNYGYVKDERDRDGLARAALNAAFAALPECEEAQDAVAYYQGQKALDALAREFGEPT